MNQATDSSTKTSVARQHRLSTASPRGIRRRKETLHVQVGLDFGTSATKIAYQLLDGRHIVRPLLFNNRNGSRYASFCLPSVVAITPTGDIAFGHDAVDCLASDAWDAGLRRLKVIVAGRYDDTFADEASQSQFERYVEEASVNLKDYEPEHFVTAFLAFTLNLIRDSIASRYDTPDAELAFNMCMPIDHIENNPVKVVFERILSAAEATEKDMPKYATGRDLLDAARSQFDRSDYATTTDRRTFVVPEAVASMASYLVSLRVRDGIHAVYDFGSGTTDVSIFNLFGAKTGRPSAFWYAARNLPTGMYHLERAVSACLGAGKEISETAMTEILADYLRQTPRVRKAIHAELMRIWKTSHTVWREAYGHLRKQGEWEGKKVRVFLCGGGCRLRALSGIFAQAWMEDWEPYSTDVVPPPDDYTLGDAVPYWRLAVAYGLAQPIPQLNEYILPADAPDDTPIRPQRRHTPIYGFDAPDT